MINSKRQSKKHSWKKLVLKFFIVVSSWLVISFGYREWQQSQWDGQSQFAWVEQKETIKVILVLPEKQQQLVFPLAGDQLVKIGFGFGEYRLNKAFELGELEKSGGRVLARAAQNYLGIGVQGFIKDRQTNLSFWDRLRLRHFYWFKVNGRVKNIEKINDENVHQEIFSAALAAEPISVAILNASGVDGAAAEVNRLITNLGIEVSFIGNLETISTQSYMAYNRPDISSSRTKKALQSLINLEQRENFDIEKYRSDIVIVMGKDYTDL